MYALIFKKKIPNSGRTAAFFCSRLGVEEQDPYLLDRRMAHRRLQIVAQRIPARQDGSPFNPRFEKAERARLRDLQRADDSVGQPFAAQRFGVRAKQRTDAAEPGDKASGLLLRVAPRDGKGKEVFDQLMIEQRLAATFEQALAEPGAMPAIAGVAAVG